LVKEGNNMHNNLKQKVEFMIIDNYSLTSELDFLNSFLNYIHSYNLKLKITDHDLERVLAVKSAIVGIADNYLTPLSPKPIEIKDASISNIKDELLMVSISLRKYMVSNNRTKRITYLSKAYKDTNIAIEMIKTHLNYKKEEISKLS
jgi:hypothetical protein